MSIHQRVINLATMARFAAFVVGHGARIDHLFGPQFRSGLQVSDISLFDLTISRTEDIWPPKDQQTIRGQALEPQR